MRPKGVERNDLIAHPIRLRILGALAEREATTEQVRRLLDDVARATFYRHLGLLIEAGLIEVAEAAYRPEGRDRLLRLAENAGALDRDAIDPSDPEQNQRMVEVFLSAAASGFAQFLRSEESEGRADDWMCRGAIAYLDADEVREVREEMISLLGRIAGRPRRAHSRRYRLAVFTLPDPDLPNPEQT